MVTTDIETAITAAGVAGGVIGLAVLVMKVGIKAYKWVRAAM